MTIFLLTSMSGFPYILILLPVSFVLNYTVNDIIVINAQEYYINSIQTDLTTGKSQLELIVKKATYTNSVLT